MADVLENLFRLLLDAFSAQGNVQMTGPLLELVGNQRDMPEDVVEGLGEAVRLLQLVQWATFDQNDLRETRLRITFAPAAVSP